MICREARALLHPFADGELDLVRHLEVERHLADCAACSAEHTNLGSLRAAISSPNLYQRAPPGLRSRIRRAAPLNRPRLRASARLLAGVAAVLVVIAGSVAVGRFLPRPGASADDRLAEAVVVAHVRSLQPGHTTDVASSDRHTVKPWFRGKLDFSPPVPDLADQGYPLAGGRMDYLPDRPAAALVYHRRAHPINLFVWSGGDDLAAPTSLVRQGYHLRSWQQAGMTYCAISDLGEQELDEFVRLFTDSTRPPRP